MIGSIACLRLSLWCCRSLELRTLPKQQNPVFMRLAVEYMGTQ
jgi:hypothetical protein